MTPVRKDQAEHSRAADREVVAGERSSFRRPAVRFATVLLSIFVLYFGLGGLVARIEPEELPVAVTIDVLVGISIVVLFALNSDSLMGGPSGWKRLIPTLVLGLMCSGILIGWHCLTLHLRHRAVEHRRQLEEEERSPAADVAE